jgi:hypothetical protein
MAARFSGVLPSPPEAEHVKLRRLLLSLSLGLTLASTASAAFPFGFWRWSGFGYGPGIHAYHCCPTCAPPPQYQGGWVPYGAPLMLEPPAAPLESPIPVPAKEAIPSPAPQALRATGWSSAGASLR